MKRIEIEFASYVPTPWALWGAALMACIWCGVEFHQYDRLRDQNEEVRARLEQLKIRASEERHHQDKDSSANASVALERQKMLEALDYDWNSVLQPVESAYSSQVSLMSFEHDRLTGSTQLQLEGTDLAAMFGYVRDLNKADSNWSWKATQHQTSLVNGVRISRATVRGSRAAKRNL